MLQSVWKEFLASFEKDTGSAPIIFSILRQIKPISLTDEKITLGCENNGVMIYLASKSSVLNKALSEFLNKKIKADFVIKPKRTKDETLPIINFQPSIEDAFFKAGLHQKYRFDNFAVSTTNQVAYAAAEAVSRNPGNSYNPLFLYGGVGVGKTHLAQAVARKVLETSPQKKVYFCPGDHFTNELIDSIRERTTQKFRRKYRHLQILVVDDIQFIAGKQTVQEEFFHTFNTIVSSGGQVILTSDRPPGDIKNLEDRLRSRFSGGLIVDVQSPDFELRTAILLIKAKEKSIEIDIESAKVIAERITDSRALEGTLLSLYAKVLGKKEVIDLETVEDYFQNRTEAKVKKISSADIVRAVCSFYNVKPSHLKGPLRVDNIARARQITMYILRRELKTKYEEIAYILKKKDHTTVLYGVEKISSLIMKDPIFKQEIDTIISSLNQST